jgi:hypothetical protein
MGHPTRRSLLLAPVLLSALRSQSRPLTPEPVRGFAPDELLLIQSYFKGEGKKYLPVLERIESRLPAAALDRLKVGQPMPPVLQKSTSSLPDDLFKRLPPPAPGLVRGLLGLRVLLVRRQGWILVDLLRLAPDAKKSG